ncbi:unnamed protein product [Clavelina lepadiformis]|uniref:Epidermal retinol dehydrogenase 2 n=1 Tax=Clavelina lepadiformis TaxID=159417 RepID=A0ABP0F2I9_CLALP
MDFKEFGFLILSHFIAIYYWLEAIFRFFVPRARKDVRGDIVLVTGAGSGIGQRLCIEFGKLGCEVVGWDISEVGLERTKKIMADENLESHFFCYKCDLSDRHQVYDSARKVKSDVGDVTILINNAGIVTGKKIMDCHDELMIKTMEINAISHFWTIKAFLPSMLEKDCGHIVTVASGAGLFGVPGQVDYAASKFAAVGLTDALNMELVHMKKNGVKTTTVCPYYIDTGMFDGVDTSILPIIKLDAAVELIVDAILREKVYLLMPRLLYFIYGLRGLLPAKSMLIMGKATGVLRSMDSFVGRNKSK